MKTIVPGHHYELHCHRTGRKQNIVLESKIAFKDIIENHASSEITDLLGPDMAGLGDEVITFSGLKQSQLVQVLHEKAITEQNKGNHMHHALITHYQEIAHLLQIIEAKEMQTEIEATQNALFV